MQTDRQIYKDSSIAEAIAKRCDCVQLKWDGWWSRIELANGFARFYSRTNRLFKELELPAATDFNHVLIGEHMQGTQWSQEPGRLGRTIIFDCWMCGGQDVTEIDYRSRYSLAKSIVRQLPETFSLVDNWPIAHAEDLWIRHVDYEGLVFRNSKETIAGTIYRHKRTVTEDLLCTGFIEGMGKFVGTLGAINGETTAGVKVDVGGGFDDQQRREIWENQSFYMGKWFEMEARMKFESGSFRHPNFIKWRMDK